MEPSLVIMAAGLGSRFGSLKQLAPVGPSGETILQYSIYDAHRSGFKKVVFIIQSFFADEFKAKILPSAEKWMEEVVCVYQDTTPPRLGIDLPLERKKPLGTAHAVLAAADVVNEPFAVINADDFYGADAFSCLYDFLSNQKSDKKFAMVGYILKNTLTENGTVSRGICAMNDQGNLSHVEEYRDISQKQGFIIGENEKGEQLSLVPETSVSLNTWAFSPLIFEKIQDFIKEFLSLPKEVQLEKECFLPTVVDEMIHSGEATVSVLPCHSQWYGVTYQEDLAFVQEAILKMIENGIYPENLLD